MNDCALLDLAAKAAGIDLEENRHCPSGGIWIVDKKSGLDVVWSPLTNDGDALRLAIKLGICIVFMEDHDSVGAEHSRHGVMIIEAMDDFGTRRAIVRAAAEIGKTTP